MVVLGGVCSLLLGVLMVLGGWFPGALVSGESKDQASSSKDPLLKVGLVNLFVGDSVASGICDFKGFTAEELFDVQDSQDIVCSMAGSSLHQDTNANRQSSSVE